jgi:predicted nucleic acid-binding protein
MRKLRKDIPKYFLDTNVFIAAIKNPKKETGTLRLILKIIESDDIHLIGDEFLIEEMVRYAEEFRSETASWILGALLTKMDIVEVTENFIKICKSYIRTPNLADIIHAAICLKTDAVLITNDSYFNKIRDEGIIEVWSIRKAIDEFKLK